MAGQISVFGSIYRLYVFTINRRSQWSSSDWSSTEGSNFYGIPFEGENGGLFSYWKVHDRLLHIFLRYYFINLIFNRVYRDLVRLLQNVARIPEFEGLWKDVLLNPKSLSPNFNGILQLLQTRTSRRFLQSRLTPDMERKLVFLTSQVRFGNHKRYQDWFQRQYLATPESQSLRCDLIRFIVGVIHPTNELLCSDIIPRWAVIGWLFTTCTSTVAASNAKLALFYDWLFFEPEKDNIMNIEPAILVMHNSMRSHPPVTATLLDFLCRVSLFAHIIVYRVIPTSYINK